MDIFNDKEQKKIDEAQNELDDIILDKKNKNLGIKKIIFLSGIVILLFIIIITLVKVTSSNTTKNKDFIINTPPPQEQANKNSEGNYQQVPIEEESEETNVFKNQPKETTKEEKVEQSTIKEVKKEKNTQNLEQTTVTTKKKIQSSKQKQKISTKKENRIVKKHSKTKFTSKGEYFVQVAAFFRLSPSKKFIKNIKSNGFDYVIKTIIKDHRSIKKVLIGPFKSRHEAKKYLLKIKKRINKNAYIIRIKE